MGVLFSKNVARRTPTSPAASSNEPVELSKDDYIAVHKIILDSEMKETYLRYLSLEATNRKSPNVNYSDRWMGTVLPPAVKQTLDKKLDLNRLYKGNLLSQEKDQIELWDLVRKLPDDILEPYFKPVNKLRGNEDELKRTLKDYSKGTIGLVGQAGFGILLSSTIKNNLSTYSSIVTFAANDLQFPDDTQKGKISKKNIDPKSVVVVTNHETIAKLAPILNFPGAGHYISASIHH